MGQALALPEGLQQLRLNLARCAVGPEGIKTMHFPARLTALDLDLAMCRIGLEGARALLAKLPAKLDVLELELGGCGLTAEQLPGLREAAARLMPSLLTC